MAWTPFSYSDVNKNDVFEYITHYEPIVVHGRFFVQKQDLKSTDVPAKEHNPTTVGLLQYICTMDPKKATKCHVSISLILGSQQIQISSPEGKSLPEDLEGGDTDLIFDMWEPSAKQVKAARKMDNSFEYVDPETEDPISLVPSEPCLIAKKVSI